MSVDCGDCNSFRAYAERYYHPLLSRYGFRLAECAAAHGGRECALLYRSDRCQLLLTLSDGSDDCLLGGLEQPFPGTNSLRSNGEQGWYHVVALIEWKSGKKLLTSRLLDEFRDGKRVYFSWESQLVAQWADQLFDLFAPGKPREWHEDFARFARARRYA